MLYPKLSIKINRELQQPLHLKYSLALNSLFKLNATLIKSRHAKTLFSQSV